MGADEVVLRRAHLRYAAERGCWWLQVPADSHGGDLDHWYAPGPLPPSEETRAETLAGWGLRRQVNAFGEAAVWQWFETPSDEAPGRSQLHAGLWVTAAVPAATAATAEGEATT